MPSGVYERTAEHKAKISAGKKGHRYMRGISKNVSEDGREAMAANGRNSAYDPEARRKQVESRTLPWIYVVTEDGRTVEADTQVEMAEAMGVTEACIGQWRKRGKCVRYLATGDELKKREARQEARRKARAYDKGESDPEPQSIDTRTPAEKFAEYLEDHNVKMEPIQ